MAHIIPFLGNVGYSTDGCCAANIGAAGYRGADGGAAGTRHHRRFWARWADHWAAARRAPHPLCGCGRPHGLCPGQPSFALVHRKPIENYGFKLLLRALMSAGAKDLEKEANQSLQARRVHAVGLLAMIISRAHIACRLERRWISQCTLEMQAAARCCTAWGLTMQHAQSSLSTHQVRLLLSSTEALMEAFLTWVASRICCGRERCGGRCFSTGRPWLQQSGAESDCNVQAQTTAACGPCTSTSRM